MLTLTMPYALMRKPYTRQGGTGLDPDMIDPECRQQQFCGGEKFLWAAVLVQAALDSKSSDATIRGDAISWIESTRTHVGSFIFCCETLNRNHNTVRNDISRLDKKRIRRMLV